MRFCIVSAEDLKLAYAAMGSINSSWKCWEELDSSQNHREASLIVLKSYQSGYFIQMSSLLPILCKWLIRKFSVQLQCYRSNQLEGCRFVTTGDHAIKVTGQDDGY
jgi:hypothetical protein